MPRSREIASILGGFLGTFSSRYPDVDGLWAFGPAVSHFEALQIDLWSVEEQTHPSPEVVDLLRIARRMFREQAEKHKLTSRIRSAQLHMVRSPNCDTPLHNAFADSGYFLLLNAEATSTLGRVCRAKCSIVVAPTSHNR
jgi:hypothetical protein